MTNPTPLSPTAQAVLHASAVEACLAEWGPVNDPPCHPDDEGWNGCHLCVKRDLIAAALRAVALEVVLNKYQYADWQMADMIMNEIQDIATELEGSND